MRYMSIPTAVKFDLSLLAKALLYAEDEFESLVRSRRGDLYYKWLAYSYKLRRDPSLVAYYTFERDEQNKTVLENKAVRTGRKA